MKLAKGRIALASTAGLVLTLASVHLLAPARVQAQSPTATPQAVWYHRSVSPPDGTWVDPTKEPPITYSLTVNNGTNTATGPIVVHFDFQDVSQPSVFSSTQGSCVWSDLPDYGHGASSGDCDLGSLAPSPSSATITLNTKAVWNYYMSRGPSEAGVMGSSDLGFTYPWGTPTPTSGTSAPVGGIVEMPNVDGSSSSGGNAGLIGGVGVGVGALASAAAWLARKRWSASK